MLLNNTFTVDNTAPVISAVTITAGTYKIGSVIPVTITADAAGYTAGAITINGQALGSFADAGAGSYTGTYTVVSGDTDRASVAAIPVSVVLTDAAGNSNGAYVTAPTSGGTVTVDANKPTISAVTITAGTYKIGSVIPVTITADAAGYTAGAITINGQALGSFADAGAGSYTGTYTVVSGDTDRAAVGDIPVSVVLVDAAGNSSVAYTAAPGSGGAVTVDAHAPATPVITSIATDNKINNAEKAAIHVVGTAEANALVSVTLSDGVNSKTGTEQLVGGGTAYDITIDGTTATALVDGTITPSVTATDAAGNISSAATTPTATQDIVAPSTPTITSIATDNYISNAEKAAIHVIGTAEANALVSATLTDGVNSKTGTQQLVGGATAFDITIDGTAAAPGALSDGVITPSVTATDAAGNVSSAVATPTSTQDIVAPTATAAVSPSTGYAKVGTVATTTLTAGGSQADLVIGGACTVNGVDVSGTFVNATGGSYTLTYTVAEGNTNRTSGNLPISCVLREPAGNTVTVSTYDVNTLVLDANTPVAPAITTIAGAGNRINNAEKAAVAVVGTTSEADVTVTVTLSDGTSFITGTANATTSAYTVTLDATSLTDGAITASSTAMDAAGNISSATSGSATKDIVAPSTPTITSIATDNYINDVEKGAIHVIGTAEAGSTVNVLLTSVATVTGSGTATGGNYDITIDGTTLTDGTVTPSVTATDAAGNVSSAVATPTATMDVVTPDLPTAVTFSAIGGTVTANTLNTTNTNFVATSTITANQAVGGYAELLKGGVSFSPAVTSSLIIADQNSVSFNAGLSSNGAVQSSFGSTAALSVRVYDAAGNYSTSTVANPTVTVDYVVPTFSSVALGADEYVNNTETGTGVNIVIATTGLEDGRTVSCTITGTTGSVGPVTGAIGTNAVTIASTALTALADGTITATCNVTDTAGNPAVAGTDTATKDVVAPTLPVTGLVGRTIQGSGDTITFTFNGLVQPTDGTWSANEFDSIKSPSGTTLTLTNATFSPTSGATTTLTVTLNEATDNAFLRNGNVVLATPASNKIQDAAGNYVVNSEITGTTANTGDAVQPTVSLAYTYTNGGGAVSGGNVFPGESITITATFSEAAYESTVPTIAIDTPSNDISASNMTKTSATVWYYNWTVPANTSPSAQGIATSTIVATDLAGNSNTTATSNTIVIDSIAPVVNSFTATSITATGASLTATTNENATCKYANTEKDYASMTTMATTTGVTTHSQSLTGLTAATSYNYYVRCADTYGNTMGASASVAFTTSGSDVVGPTISAQTPTDGTTTTAITASPTLTFSEALDASTVNGATIQLRASSTDVAVSATVLYNSSTYVVTIDPVASLDYNTSYYIWVSGVKDAAGNALTTDYSVSAKASHEFTTVAEANGSLGVTQVTASSTYATTGGGFTSGWSWTFNVTVPTSETSSTMKFADWVSGANTIAAASNIRFYSAQSSNANSTSTAITVSAANTYADYMTLNADLDSTTVGRQIQIVVEGQVPTGSAAGSYSTSYGIKSE